MFEKKCKNGTHKQSITLTMCKGSFEQNYTNAILIVTTSSFTKLKGRNGKTTTKNKNSQQRLSIQKWNEGNQVPDRD